MGICVGIASGCGVATRESVAPTPVAANERAVTQAFEVPTPGEPLPRSSDYVVAAGLRWLVVLDIESLLERVSVIAPELLPQNNVQGFERSLGLELRTLHEVAIAGFDYSTLYVVRGTADFDATRTRFSSRLAVDPLVTSIGRKQLYTGLFDNEVVHYATLDQTTASWSNGDPTPAKAALLLAQRQLRRSPSALDGASLQLLPESCKQGPAIAFVPGPIGSPPGTEPSASGVLDATLAVAIRATIEAKFLALRLCWRGDWKEDGIRRTKALLDTVLNSRFATLLELTAEERAGTFTQHDELVEVSYRWAAAKVLRRLQAVLSLDLGTLLAQPEE